MDSNSFAIVTPSFLPDIERCAFLAESIDRNAIDMMHYLIIDRRDVQHFRFLESARRKILISEDLIGRWLTRLPGRRGWWVSLRTPPVRGWILQQLLKISVATEVTETTLIFCDSDTAFVRPFSGANLMIDGRIGLLDVAFQNRDIVRWARISRKILGLPMENASGDRGHVGNMICWDRATAIAMREHIARVHRLPWQIVLARCPTFSEYMLYGTFVREFLGYDATNHAPSDRPLVKANWGQPICDGPSASQFVSAIAPEAVAIMIHSKDGSNLHHVRDAVRQRWSVKTPAMT
jgi:hypothetical protein